MPLIIYFNLILYEKNFDKIRERMRELKLNQLFNENTYKKALILNDNNINKSLDWIRTKCIR